jgi:hypothetical protein
VIAFFQFTDNIRIISKRVGDDRRIQGAKGSRIQGKTIKTAKSNWLRYPSGRKYAIFLPSVQEINSARKPEPI